jgi:aryl-alcohol dehydrogenase-like predicted oxidoreductase
MGVMKQRRIGRISVTAIGLGCMNLSHAYGAPPPVPEAEALLHAAIAAGVTYFDSAALYGFGANEELVGQALRPYRGRILLASKCGMTGVDGKRVIDGRPATIKLTCDDSLRRLQTEVIDLYYLHRWDKTVPIEDSVGALSDLVRAGKVRAIGLSEVSASTLRRAHAVHPISALQNEYSLWARNPEIAGLAACQELGIAFVAFSPLARRFLTGTLRDVAGFADKDIRRAMPRFSAENYAANLRLLDEYAAIARAVGCTQAQLALAWLLARGDNVLPIPGTTRIEHLRENMGALAIELDAATIARLDALINQDTVVGARYNATTQTEIDTEEFPSS